MSPDVFRSMGVDVVVGGATAAELGRIRRLFDEWDRVFSRFRPTSELSLVNAVPRDTVLVSPLFAHVVRVALDAARSTGGLVDPTSAGRSRRPGMTATSPRCRMTARSADPSAVAPTS